MRAEIELVRLENEFLTVDVAPRVGGRVVSVKDKESRHEFLWRNQALDLERVKPGSEYDPNFYGGIDELLPNDIPETIGGVVLPDHGELWTMELNSTFQDGALTLSGQLPVYGLDYRKKMTLRPGSPHLDFEYRLRNTTRQSMPFLWKLHAAIRIEPNDLIYSTARMARPVDADWTRWSTIEPFRWPVVDQQRADIVPPPSNQVDFLYLYDLTSGVMGWKSPSRGLEFTYHFDTGVFPYSWLFGSYGGFNDHYTAVLEPCTAMPMSLVEANHLGQCSVVAPGEELSTKVSVFAGHTRGVK